MNTIQARKLIAETSFGRTTLALFQYQMTDLIDEFSCYPEIDFEGVTEFDTLAEFEQNCRDHGFTPSVHANSKRWYLTRDVSDHMGSLSEIGMADAVWSLAGANIRALIGALQDEMQTAEGSYRTGLALLRDHYEAVLADTPPEGASVETTINWLLIYGF